MAKNKKNIGKALLTAGLISLSSLLPARAIAQETQIQKPAVEKTLEEKAGLNISVNAERTIGTENNYSHDSSENSVYSYSGLSDVDADEINNIIAKVDNNTIDSYGSFVDSISPLKVNQKLSLLSAISNSLYIYDYNIDLLYGTTLSQEEFFKDFQNSLKWIYGDLGVCRQISTHIEELANDIGLRAAAVSGINEGIGHAYDIIKTNDGIAIVDGYKLLTTNTNNVEDVLGLYQKMSGSVAFQHSFFEDAKFKYKLITSTGKDFLDFAGYDESLSTLEHSLFEHGNSNQKIAINLDTKNYLNSIETNLIGFFLKYGQIKSASDSEFNMNIFQVGYKKEFLIPGIIQINPDLSILSGSFKIFDTFFGLNGGLFVSTDFEKLNFSLGLKGNITNNESPYYITTLFDDFSIEAGASYKINIKNISITPYLLAQLSEESDFESWKSNMILKDIHVGSKFDFLSGSLGLSINPYYSRKMWEQELGADVKFNYKNFGINLGGYATQSSYDFCPNKRGIEIETSISSDNFGGKVSYKNDLTDYSGETSNNSSFSISGQIKL